MKYKLPYHGSNSYKGQVGKVLVVGGSEKYYGAPILTALGAENSGADLITLCLPSKHADIARNYSLNLFVHEFQKDHLSSADVKAILELASTQDVLIIGNGLGEEKEAKKALLDILSKIKIPVVIDAEGLVPEILDIKHQSDWIVTPHKKEFERLFNSLPNENTVQQQAKKYHLTILAKGVTDIIADPSGQLYQNKTGCAEMRVGGTGDVLAGIVGSFIGQKISPFDACCSATYYWGLSGEELSKKHKWLTAHYMARKFSSCVWHALRSHND
jgi:hydroxyethylthiazole kinase-like uncharacterized protein yjeF